MQVDRPARQLGLARRIEYRQERLCVHVKTHRRLRPRRAYSAYSPCRSSTRSLAAGWGRRWSRRGAAAKNGAVGGKARVVRREHIVPWMFLGRPCRSRAPALCLLCRCRSFPCRSAKPATRTASHTQICAPDAAVVGRDGDGARLDDCGKRWSRRPAGWRYR